MKMQVVECLLAFVRRSARQHKRRTCRNLTCSRVIPRCAKNPATSGIDSFSSFAMAIGGGVDFKVSHRFSIRPVQVDYLMTHFNELGTGAQNQQFTVVAYKSQ
jgi:hypothetical protein